MKGKKKELPSGTGNYLPSENLTKYWRSVAVGDVVYRFSIDAS